MERSVNFKEVLEEKKNYVNRIIERYLPAESVTRSRLAEAMCYSMRAGGKRIRPILMLESFRIFGGESDVILPFMAAMEMIHTHSLIHDDLPALDNDEFRRGRKTTHAVYGEAMAVLAGDALLNHAYETALQAFDEGEDPLRCAQALRILAGKTGCTGMLGGQSTDVENDKRTDFRPDMDMLQYIYMKKTAALIEAPLMAGAVLAGASPENVSLMEEIGRKTGLAFQIRDDILDVTGTQEELGKPVFSDEKNEKVTYVTLLGEEKARLAAEELTEEALLLAEKLPGDSAFLIWLLGMLAKRTQ